MDNSNIDHYTDDKIIIKNTQVGSQFPLIGFSTVTPVGRDTTTGIVDLETELLGLNNKYTCKKAEYKQ
jgi:hypothetical protein